MKRELYEEGPFAPKDKTVCLRVGDAGYVSTLSNLHHYWNEGYWYWGVVKEKGKVMTRLVPSPLMEW